MRALVWLVFSTALVVAGCGRTVMPGWFHKPRIVFCNGDCEWVDSGGYGRVCVCPEDRESPPCSSTPSGVVCNTQGDRPEMWDHCWYCNGKKWKRLDRPEPKEEE